MHKVEKARKRARVAEEGPDNNSEDCSEGEEPAEIRMSNDPEAVGFIVSTQDSVQTAASSPGGLEDDFESDEHEDEDGDADYETTPARTRARVQPAGRDGGARQAPAAMMATVLQATEQLRLVTEELEQKREELRLVEARVRRVTSDLAIARGELEDITQGLGPGPQGDEGGRQLSAVVMDGCGAAVGAAVGRTSPHRVTGHGRRSCILRPPAESPPRAPPRARVAAPAREVAAYEAHEAQEEAGAVAAQDAVAAQNVGQTTHQVTLTQNVPEHFGAHGRREVANRAAVAAAEEAAAEGGDRTMVQTTLTQAARRDTLGLAMLGRLLHHDDFVPENVNAAAAAPPLREESPDERTPPPASPPEARGSGGQVDEDGYYPFKRLMPKRRR